MSEKITLEQVLPIAATVFTGINPAILNTSVKGQISRDFVLNTAQLFAEFTLELQKRLNADK